MRVKMNLEDVLRLKARRGLVTAPETTPMRQAVALMAEHNIGALLICNQGKPVGIVSERDVLRQTARRGPEFLDLPASEVMTRNLIVGTYSDDVEAVKHIMTVNRFRHMPIMHEGKLVGMVSLGDVVRSQLTTAQSEARYLRDYIAGYYG